MVEELSGVIRAQRKKLPRDEDTIQTDIIVLTFGNSRPPSRINAGYLNPRHQTVRPAPNVLIQVPTLWSWQIQRRFEQAEMKAKCLFCPVLGRKIQKNSPAQFPWSSIKWEFGQVQGREVKKTRDP
ncbi:hypothetical protein PoB_002039700 [Plakobranchus ocellatus]|uniref:Uncharacterized protein n=1 Tax=Plakobranchus ocellatus TaxID=259542 RepID=A0AAV3ZH80_9GAST|nr:hypothetical protein PoB_002039700 [Plakobranchus ocellatus]